METYKFTIAGIGEGSISADSWKEAQEIIQAYFEKRSVEFNYTGFGTYEIHTK